MNNSGGHDNIKPIRSSEEARERGRKGGIRSGEVRREKKAMRDVLQELLNMPIKNCKLDTFNSLDKIKGKNITAQQAMCAAMIQKAIKGDTEAAKFVRDTSGNKIDTPEPFVNNVYLGADLSEFSREELLSMAGLTDEKNKQ